jgi:hypothetical protein
VMRGVLRNHPLFLFFLDMIVLTLGLLIENVRFMEIT